MSKPMITETFYKALKRLAQKKLQCRAGAPTLHATELVHEVYMRLRAKEDRRGDDEAIRWGRAEYFRAAACAMRDILVEYARRKMAHKRGGGMARVEFLDDMVLGPPGEPISSAEHILELHEALQRLERALPENAELVLLRFFAGQTNAEIARLNNVARATIDRRWRFTRAWLKKQLERT